MRALADRAPVPVDVTVARTLPPAVDTMLCFVVSDDLTSAAEVRAA